MNIEDAQELLNASSWFLARSLALSTFGDDLQEYDDMIHNRHTPVVQFYILHAPSNVLLVHLGAVGIVCGILDIPIPQKSLEVRMECMKRPDVHTSATSGSSLALFMDRLTLQMQNIEQLIRAMSRALSMEKDDVLLKRLETLLEILKVEYTIQGYELDAVTKACFR